MTDAIPQPDTIQRLGNAPFPSFAMVAGMQLEVFTPLGSGAMTAAQLAQTLGVREAKLAPLLYALVSAGLLRLDGDRFANTAEADHYLVKGKPTYLGEQHLHYAARYHETMQTAASIRTGVPQVKRDFTAMSTQEPDTVLRGLHPAARAAGRDLAKRYDFSRHRRLLDVGGGTGGLSLAIGSLCPDLRVTIFDLPAVIPITRRFIGEEGMAGRATALAGNAVNAPPSGTYDVAVLRSVIQVLPRDEARALLRNLASALEPGSPVFILGQILDDSRLSPPHTVAFNLMFINVHDEGGAYTEQEYRDWLGEAGFTGVERTRLAGGSSQITARKAG
jgi:hypothetical protein